MSHFGIGALQLALSRGDNLSVVIEEVRKAKQRFPWLDMIVLPELCAFGPAIDQAQTLPGDAERQFAAVARDLGIWLISGSLYERSGEQVFNTASAIDPSGEIVARQRKIYPFQPYERNIARGDRPVAFDVPGVGRFGIAICYDIWFPEVARTLAWSGVEVLLNPVMTNTIDRDVELAMVRATAAQNQLYVISVNVGGDLGVGHSIVAGPGGEIVHQAGPWREIIAHDIDIDHVRRCRARGWQGLGQVLKSFRDGPQSFEVYERGPQASPSLQALGPIELPTSENMNGAVLPSNSEGM